MRTEAAIRAALDAGVDRVIIGTRAAESLEFVREMSTTFGSARIAVGIDAVRVASFVARRPVGHHGGRRRGGAGR